MSMPDPPLSFQGSYWLAWPAYGIWTWRPLFDEQELVTYHPYLVPVGIRVAELARSQGRGIYANQMHWVNLTDIRALEQCPVLLGFARENETEPLSDRQAEEFWPPDTYGSSALIWLAPDTMHIMTQDMLDAADHVSLQRLSDAIQGRDREGFWEAVGRVGHAYWVAYTRLFPQAVPAVGSSAPKAYPITREGDIGFPIPLHQPVQSVIRAIQSPRWQNRDDGSPVFTGYSSETTVSMRPPAGLVIDPQKVSSALWDVVRNQTDLDADIVLIQLAQIATSPAYDDGSTWLTPEAIMDYRHIEPMTKPTVDGGRRISGYRKEDRQAVIDAFERTAYIWLTIEGERTRRRGMFTESHLTLILERVGHREGEEEQIVAWRYMMGTWFQAVVPETGSNFSWVLQKILHYDPYHERWEKRLARYILFHGNLLVATREQTIVRTVPELLEGSDLSIDPTRLKRARDRLESALNALVRDGILTSWRYSEDDVSMKQWWSATISMTYPTLYPQALLPKGETPVPSKRKRGRPPKQQPPPPLPLHLETGEDKIQK